MNRVGNPRYIDFNKIFIIAEWNRAYLNVEEQKLFIDFSK